MCKIKYGEMDTHRLNISLLCCFPSLYISESSTYFRPTVLIETKLFPWSCFLVSSLGWGFLFKWLILKFCLGSNEVARLVCPMSNQPTVILKRLYIFFFRSPSQSKSPSCTNIVEPRYGRLSSL